MIACQPALPEGQRRQARIEAISTGDLDVESTGPPDMTSTTGESFAEEPADLSAREHERRERAWQPAARWQAIQETIRWAESQATARRNTPRACIERGRRLREDQDLG
jgi:hypothetical protein